MAKTTLILSVLCILALTTTVCQAKEPFTVQGKVYCDPCRGQFRTRISENVPDAHVKLVCTNIDTQVVTFEAEATTDREGTYNIKVEGDHTNDICEVKALSSPNESCNEIMDSQLDKARIVCSDLTGMDQKHVRYANELAFVPSQVDHRCREVFTELGLSEDGTSIADDDN